MILYHGSNIIGLNQLEPMQADHDRPYAYMTTIEAVAALYLCNAVEKPYYWFPYGFDESGDIPIYHELYSDALRNVSEGKSGCIYVVNANEGQYIPFKNIPCARLGIVTLNVIDRIEVPNAYNLLQGYIHNGKLKVSRYEDKSKEQLEWWYSTVANYMAEKNMIENPFCSYAKFVKMNLPYAWELYLKKSEID